MPPPAQDTALLLVGYQNDYFSPKGVLHHALESPEQVASTLANTLHLVEKLVPTPTLIVTTPIVFTPDYSELKEPVGILKVIRDTGAFRSGSPGSETVPGLASFGSRVIEIPGKRGLNAFSNTQLDEVFREHSIRNVVLCGVVASLCIDSSGRAAHERNYRVWFVSDCISGRTLTEQRFYISEIYPLYGQVITSAELLESITVNAATPPTE